MTIHQLRFGFRESYSGAEMGVLSSSYPPGSAEPEKWLERLKQHFRLLASPNVGPPATALSHLRFADGPAVVLWRSGAGDVGRNCSRALVGPAAELDGLPLYLDDWPGWLVPDTGSSMPVVDREVLSRHRDRVAYGRTHEALDLSEQVLPLLAAVLADPARPGWTVVGAAAGTELPMLRLVSDVLKAVMEDADPAFDWTFSGFELEDDVAVRRELPRVVFVPESPMAVTTYLRLHPGLVPDPVRTMIGLAEHLIDSYVHGVETRRPEVYADRLRGLVEGAGSPTERIERLAHDWWGTLDDDRTETQSLAAVASHRPATDADPESTLVIDKVVVAESSSIPQKVEIGSAPGPEDPVAEAPSARGPQPLDRPGPAGHHRLREGFPRSAHDDPLSELLALVRRPVAQALFVLVAVVFLLLGLLIGRFV